MSGGLKLGRTITTYANKFIASGYANSAGGCRPNAAPYKRDVKSSKRIEAKIAPTQRFAICLSLPRSPLRYSMEWQEIHVPHIQ
jgi:hypothetical protein